MKLGDEVIVLDRSLEIAEVLRGGKEMMKTGRKPVWREHGIYRPLQNVYKIKRFVHP